MVKDWHGNIHNVEPIKSVDYHTHAEDAMLDRLGALFGENGLPFAAKVIFYLSASPCRRCTAGLPDRIVGLYDQIARQHPMYFSLVFSRYYTVADLVDGDNRAAQNMWNSPMEADQGYRAAEAEADQLAVDELGVFGMLNIRHISQTKTGDGPATHPIPFGYGIQ